MWSAFGVEQGINFLPASRRLGRACAPGACCVGQGAAMRQVTSAWPTEEDDSLVELACCSATLVGQTLLTEGASGRRLLTHYRRVLPHVKPGNRTCPLKQGKRYSLKEFQDAACAAAAKRFGGLHGCLPARTLEVRSTAHLAVDACC